MKFTYGMGTKAAFMTHATNKIYSHDHSILLPKKATTPTAQASDARVKKLGWWKKLVLSY